MTWLQQGFIISKTGEWTTRCLCNWDVHDLALPVVLRATMRHLHNAHDATIDFDGGRLGIPLRGNVDLFTFAEEEEPS